MTPRVTLENEILLDLSVINNSREGDVVIGGVNIPSFGNREVNVRLRLRDGESNLLAGLVKDNQTKNTSGFPGAIRLPVFKQLLSGNNETIDQTDIVMLLTPHIIRGPDISEQDLKPIYIGSAQTYTIGGQPPLLAVPAAGDLVSAPPAAAPAAAPAPARPTPALGQQTPQGTIAIPPGASPVPGTVVVPNPAPLPAAVPVAPAAAPQPPPVQNPTPEPRATAQAASPTQDRKSTR